MWKKNEVSTCQESACVRVALVRILWVGGGTHLLPGGYKGFDCGYWLIPYMSAVSVPMAGLSLPFWLECNTQQNANSSVTQLTYVCDEVKANSYGTCSFKPLVNNTFWKTKQNLS